MAVSKVSWEVFSPKSLDDLEKELDTTETPNDEEEGQIEGLSEFAETVLSAGAEGIAFDIVTSTQANRNFLRSLSLGRETEVQTPSATDPFADENMLEVRIFAPLIRSNKTTGALIGIVGKASLELEKKIGTPPIIYYVNTAHRSFAELKAKLQRDRSKPEANPLILATKRPS